MIPFLCSTDTLFYTRDDAGRANDGVYEAVLSTGQGSTRIINEDKPCKTDTVQFLTQNYGIKDNIIILILDGGCPIFCVVLHSTALLDNIYM